VLGLDGFKADLRKIVATAGRSAHTATLEAATILAASIRAGAPVDSDRTSAAVEVVSSVTTSGRASAAVEVGGGRDDAMIAAVEFGTRDQPANPFIRRGFDSAEGRAAAALAAGIAAGLPRS